MGTRSNVRFRDDGGRILTCVYRQYDGYPSGMGNDLLNILNGGDVEITNGFGGDQAAPAVFNGMGCMAAYVIGALKQARIGNVYMYPSDHEPGSCGEEYLYEFYLAVPNRETPRKVLHLKVVGIGFAWEPEYAYSAPDVVLYNGPFSEFTMEECDRARAAYDSQEVTP